MKSRCEIEMLVYKDREGLLTALARDGGTEPDLLLAARQLSRWLRLPLINISRRGGEQQECSALVKCFNVPTSVE